MIYGLTFIDNNMTTAATNIELLSLKSKYQQRGKQKFGVTFTDNNMTNKYRIVIFEIKIPRPRKQQEFNSTS